jgi:hypothetical protein
LLQGVVDPDRTKKLKTNGRNIVEVSPDTPDRQAGITKLQYREKQAKTENR